jgi:hypothetical protein
MKWKMSCIEIDKKINPIVKIRHKFWSQTLEKLTVPSCTQNNLTIILLEYLRQQQYILKKCRKQITESNKRASSSNSLHRDLNF